MYGPYLPRGYWKSQWGSMPESYARQQTWKNIAKDAARKAGKRPRDIQARIHSRFDRDRLKRKYIRDQNYLEAVNGKRRKLSHSEESSFKRLKLTDQEDKVLSEHLGRVLEAPKGKFWSNLGREGGNFVGHVVGSQYGLIGEVAGGALGSVVGSAVGSAGDTANDWLFSGSDRSMSIDVARPLPNLNMPGNFNKLAGKASMTKRGHSKLNTKRKKQVHVSKSLRKKVKEVMKDSQGTGEVIVMNRGYFSFQTVGASINADSAITGLDQFNGSTIIAEGCSLEYYQNMTSWFGALQARDLGNIALTGRRRDVMHYFRPSDFLECASMLWNGMTVPQYLGQFSRTNLFNMSTVPYTASATPIFTSDQLKGFEIDIVNSYAKHRLKNLSSRTVRITMYTVTSKRRQFQEGLSVIRDSIVADMSNDSNLLENQETALINGLNSFFQNGEFHPNMSKTFRSNYNCGTTEIVMKPGETCEHTIQGPKNYTLKFDKLTESTQPFNLNLGRYSGTSVQVFYRMQLDESFAGAGLRNDGDTAFASGGIVNSAKGGFTGVSPNETWQPCIPVSIYEKQVINIKQPVQAGFVVRNPPAATGTGQELTQKVKTKKYIMVDRRVPTSRKDLEYFNTDEENPLLVNSVTSTGAVNTVTSIRLQ